MRKVVKRISTPVLQRFVKHYFSKERKYNYKGVNAVIYPGVFFPHFTISTKLLMDFISEKDLKGKHFLELGCGSGMISVYAAKMGAQVVASDVNPTAVANAKKNAEKNGIVLETVISDLFEKLKGKTFDCIVINPPYYAKNPANDAEKAWYCGEDFEYFEKLFSTIGECLHRASEVYIILSEDCDLDAIKRVADKNKYALSVQQETTKMREKNYIFQLERI